MFHLDQAMHAARAGLYRAVLLQGAEGRGQVKQRIPMSCVGTGEDVAAGQKERGTTTVPARRRPPPLRARAGRVTVTVVTA